MKKAVALLIASLFVLLVFGNAFVFANQDLQGMIDEAKKNDVIELLNQVYEGNISITKPITIIGNEGTIIRGDGKANVISIHAEGVLLENMTVENSSQSRNSEEEYAAIKIYENNNIVKDIEIKNAYHGVYLSQAHHNTIENVHVTGRGNKAIASQGNGIHMYYSNQNKLMNNYLTGTRDGMFFDYSNENVVVGNVMSHARYGLHYMYSNQNRFVENKFIQNTGGAAIMNSHENEILNNEFSLNRSSRSFGLMLQMANDNQIVNNNFFYNQRGLFIDQSQNNRLEKNKIFQNQIGIEIWASSKNQVFTENQFFQNTMAVISAGGKGENDWSEKGRGNYWGNQIPQIDLDQNGISDVPVQYKSSLYQLIEESELTYLFLSSPTIIIYEKMNELLSKQKVMFVDDYPLIEKEKQQNSLFGFFLFVLFVSWIMFRRQWR